MVYYGTVYLRGQVACKWVIKADKEISSDTAVELIAAIQVSNFLPAFMLFRYSGDSIDDISKGTVEADGS